MITTNNNKQVIVGIRMPAEEVEQLDLLAETDGRTRSGYLYRLISSHLKEVAQ